MQSGTCDRMATNLTAPPLPASWPPHRRFLDPACRLATTIAHSGSLRERRNLLRGFRQDQSSQKRDPDASSCPGASKKCLRGAKSNCEEAEDCWFDASQWLRPGPTG